MPRTRETKSRDDMLTNLLVSIVVTIATNTTEYISRWEKSVPTWPHYRNIVNGQQHSDAPVMENWETRRDVERRVNK